MFSEKLALRTTAFATAFVSTISQIAPALALSNLQNVQPKSTETMKQNTQNSTNLAYTFYEDNDPRLFNNSYEIYRNCAGSSREQIARCLIRNTAEEDEYEQMKMAGIVLDILGILGGAGLFSRGSHRISGSSVSELSGKLRKGSVTLTDGTIVSRADDGVKFSKGGKSTNVVDDLADNPRNRGSLADDFARGCTSSLFDLKQQLAQLKVTQIASLSLTAEMLKPQNSSFLKDDGSFDIAKKLCASWTDDFANFKQTQEAGKYLDLLPLEGQGQGFRFKPKANINGKPVFEYKNTGRKGTGLVDEAGNVWIPDDTGLNNPRGNFHWDVQVPNLKTGRYDHFNINPDGGINH